MVLSPNDEEVANSSKKHTQFKTRVHKPYPISHQKGLKQTYRLGSNRLLVWGRTYLYSPYKGLPPGAKNALQIMSLAAYASETNKRSWTEIKRSPDGESRIKRKYWFHYCLLSEDIRQQLLVSDFHCLDVDMCWPEILKKTMFPVFRVDNYISPTQQYVVSRAWNPIIVKKCSLLFIL